MFRPSFFLFAPLTVAALGACSMEIRDRRLEAADLGGADPGARACGSFYRFPTLGGLADVFYDTDCLRRRGAIQREEGRPSLETVLSHYQIVEDDMVDFTAPGLCSWFTDTARLSRSEANLLAPLGCLDLNAVDGIKKRAYKWSRSVVSAGGKTYLGRNHGHRDALRHAFGSAQLARRFSPAWALALTAAHEARPLNQDQATVEAMDLYNDTVGIELVLTYPDLRDRALETMLEKLLQDGRLIVHDAQGRLAWSDQVRAAVPDQPDRVAHGDPVKLQQKGKIPLPTLPISPKRERQRQR